jgi:hypothetical protein
MACGPVAEQISRALPRTRQGFALHPPGAKPLDPVPTEDRGGVTGINALAHCQFDMLRYT